MPTTPLGLASLIWRHPANRGRRGRALTQAAAWQAYKRTVRRPFELRFAAGRFRCYPDSTEPGRLIYFNGLPDYDEMLFMRRYLRPGDAFIDGGAHAGLYTLLAASLVGRQGAVHAFEVAPSALARLCENVALNELGQVKVHAQALSDRVGEVPFVIDRDTGAGNRIRTMNDPGRATVQAAATTLDASLGGRRFAMGKLDIEGAEPLALAGAERLIGDASPPVWELEFVDRYMRRFGWTAEALAGWLGDRGYDLATYDARSNQLRCEFEPGSATNALAVARSAKEEVLNRLTDQRTGSVL